MKTIFFLLAVIFAPVWILRAIEAAAGILEKTAGWIHTEAKSLLPMAERLQERTREAAAKIIFFLLVIIRLAAEQLAGLAREGATAFSLWAAGWIRGAWQQIRAAWIFRREILAECKA